MEQAKKKYPTRGFASMDPERQRQIASEGGKAAHMKGTGHEFTSDEAREAGRKGGLARAARNQAARDRRAANNIQSTMQAQAQTPQTPAVKS